MAMPSGSARFDTAQIGPLREFLNRFANLKSSVGDFVCFRVVVDANFVIQELMQRVRYPARRTALEELIRATVVDAYAPRWLDSEMESAIAQTSAKRKMSADALKREWLSYRGLLKWDDSLRVTECRGLSVDPKDTPYIDLDEKISAHSILSKDSPIKQMGGHPLTLDFLFSARRYARGAVACVSIRVMGVVFSMVAVTALVQSIRTAMRALMSLPDGGKVLLLLAAIAALLYPGARQWIWEMRAEVGELLTQIWSVISEFVLAAAAMASEAQSDATSSLAEAVAAVRPYRPAQRRRRRFRRLHRNKNRETPPLLAAAIVKGA
jgi:predicted nucleic acid-binding protein